MEPQGVQLASKIHSGGLPGGQVEKNTFLKASRTPQGLPLGDYLGTQNRSKAVMEALPTRNWYRREFWSGFETSWTPIFRWFFKPS